MRPLTDVAGNASVTSRLSAQYVGLRVGMPLIWSSTGSSIDPDWCFEAATCHKDVVKVVAKS